MVQDGLSKGSNGAIKLTGLKQGLRTPLLLKNAFSSGLTRVLAGRNLKTPAPAITVMEVSIQLQSSLFLLPFRSPLF